MAMRLWAHKERNAYEPGRYSLKEFMKQCVRKHTLNFFLLLILFFLSLQGASKGVRNSHMRLFFHCFLSCYFLRKFCVSDRIYFKHFDARCRKRNIIILVMFIFRTINAIKFIPTKRYYDC